MWHLLGRCQGLRAFLLFLRRLGVVLWAPALAQSMLGPCSVGGVCEGIPQTRGSFSLLGVRGTGEGPRPALLLPASLWPRHLQAPQDPRRHGGVGTSEPQYSCGKQRTRCWLPDDGVYRSSDVISEGSLAGCVSNAS